MPSRSAKKRMVVVANNLHERPIATLAVDEQYRRLLERGELAADKRLASAVLCRALQALKLTLKKKS